MLKKTVNNQLGFTLVEMLVTLSIFAVAFVMVTSIYASVTTAQNRAKVSVEYLNEGSLVFEQLIREIRGKTIDTGSACPPTCDADGDTTRYVCLKDLANGKTFLRFNKANSSVEINRSAICSPNGAWTRISDPAVKVTNLQFISQAGVSDEQPMTTVLMTVEPKTPTRASVPINLQTSVSSRVFLPAKPIAP
jgi:prepilin-type N-terminal cleavage/methylation domain-containing protein